MKKGWQGRSKYVGPKCLFLKKSISLMLTRSLAENEKGGIKKGHKYAILKVSNMLKKC